MHRCTLFLVMAALTCQSASLYASCPAGMPNEIFCDDFDSYCESGGPPGTPNCASDASRSNAKLQEVWYPLRDSGCYGTDMRVEDGKTWVIADVYSGRYANQFDMGQMSVRDWVSSDPVGGAKQVLDIGRFVQNVHGIDSNAVNGTTDEPLVMSFNMASNLERLFYSSGYMELALGDHHDRFNRANTDYVAKSADCCSDPSRLPFPVICAQANPDGTLPEGCPDVNLNPPAVHRAIAIGALAHMDIDPCDGCLPSPPQYRQNNRHLALFDGRVWWTLQGSGPLPPGAVVSGEMYLPLDGEGNPVPPPADFPHCEPGDFDLVSVIAPNNTSGSQTFLYISLTVRETTLKVEYTARIRASNARTYWVTSVMDNIPRQYLGSFDRIRAGVGPGCGLASNAEWSTCDSIAGRTCLWNNSANTTITFDKFVLYGGTGVTLPGACCKADGSCDVMAKADCEAFDQDGNPMGYFLGADTTCAAAGNCCPLAYGDADNDGDVDMDDFADIQKCLTIGGGATDPACRCLDYDGSNTVDNNDLLKFIECANGPNVPADKTVSCRARGW